VYSCKGIYISDLIISCDEMTEIKMEANRRTQKVVEDLRDILRRKTGLEIVIYQEDNKSELFVLQPKGEVKRVPFADALYREGSKCVRQNGFVFMPEATFATVRTYENSTKLEINLDGVPKTLTDFFAYAIPMYWRVIRKGVKHTVNEVIAANKDERIIANTVMYTGFAYGDFTYKRADL